MCGHQSHFCVNEGMKLRNLIFVGALLLGVWVIVATASAKSTPAPSYEPRTVLELFTSQGCPSCPKANAIARELVNDPDVLVLSYSVDYWDYLGWKDTFSKPEFSKRQRTYAKHFRGQVYTPQMVVNGAEHGKIFKPKSLKHKVLSHDGVQISLNLSNGDKDKKVQIRVMNRSNAQTPYVMVVRYKPGIHNVSVVGGRNRGKTMGPANVVTDCFDLGQMNGKKLETVRDLPQGEAMAVLVHEFNGGPILASAVISPS